MMERKDFMVLVESATEKANASQALRAIGEKCQKIATELSDVKLKDLPTVVKTLKLNSDNDLESIRNVEATVHQYLDQMIDTCMEASSKIDDLSYNIMGDLDLRMSDDNLEKITDELDIEDDAEDLSDESDNEIEELDLDNLGDRKLK